MIAYICNRERPRCKDACKNDPDYECKRTCDLSYAKNWDREPTQEELSLYFRRYGNVHDPDYTEVEE